MAFVFQAERAEMPQLNNLSQDIGPGSYITHEQYKVKQGNAPFNSSVSRSESIKHDNIPGPGSYDQDNQHHFNNYGMYSSPKLMKLIDKKQQSSNFASQSKRFEQQNIMMTPGPGSYEIDKVQMKPIQQQYMSQNYMELLQSLNRYQSIPSIPANNQVYGYTEKGAHDLESNKNPQPTYSGIKSDTVGPGKYQIKDGFEYNKNKGTCWHKSRTPRLVPSIAKDENQNLGPGSYDSNRSITPLYKLNPSGNFQSKSNRTFDNAKGDKQKQFMKNYFEKQKEKLMRNPGFQDLEDEQFQFCDDTTPGPGHYFGNTSQLSVTSSNSQQSIKNGKNCFGSKSKRFQEQKLNYLIGPGEYQLETEILKQNIMQPPFLSSNTRFEQKLIGQLPGPQTYDTKISLQEKLTKKLERTPVGNFGINEARFKEDYSQIPGPGTYNSNDKILKGINSIFKSKTERVTGPKNRNENYPAPGYYDVKNNSLELYIKKDEEEKNQDLKQQKPAFGSSMPRFIDKKNQIVNELLNKFDDQEEEIEKLHNTSSLLKKPKNIQVAFNENRFQNKKKDTYKLGPGQYYTQDSSKWNKTSFNILFQKV